MNAMQILSLQPWVERLGWTLVHFLWQGLLIAALYAAAGRGIARTSTPNARYLLGCAALAAMMAAPLVTWRVMQPQPAYTASDAAYRIHSSPRAASATGINLETGIGIDLSAIVPGAQPAQFLRWVVIAWLAGAAVFWMRLAGGWVVAARMRRVQVRRAPPEWQEILDKLGRRIGVSCPVRLLVSALVQAPVVAGWLRPVVLAPVGALSGLPAGYLEALLLHELAHVRRHDYLVNILQSAVEALLFYHPAVWWVSGHIRAERELCCDDVAVSASGDALTYARALAQLESYRPAHLGAVVAANGGSLSARIARLLGQPRPATRGGAGAGVLTVAILLLAAAYGLFGQAAPAAFQVVSIKRNTSGGPIGLGVNSSLLLLIQFAYATHNSPYAGHTIPLPASQVVGGPPWIHTENWDIVIKSRPADPKQYLPMWQTLLADRFKLRLHRETRELPIYVLTAAESGFKLPAPPKDVGCVSFPAGTKPHQVPGKVDCGYISGPGSMFPGGARLDMRGFKIHMADLVSELALILDRPISDHTGFTGDFDVKLNFASSQAAGANRPGIFAALEQQLGLKLAPATGPVEVLVVDHAERPAAN